MNKFISVKEASLKWNLSRRTVRHYCAQGRVDGAIFKNGSWQIPEDAKKPKRINEKPKKNHLLEKLREEKSSLRKGGIYHKLQVDLTYNSNHMEGSELSHEETRYIFETRTIGLENKALKVDDIIETINHFTAVDRVIDFCNYTLSEAFIKELHKILKSGTADSRLPRFAVGDYKKQPNMVGDFKTTPPRLVGENMKKLIDAYNQKKSHTLEEIIEFHVHFEQIHPFQDGNGRVGRLIAFKECLKNNIVPFIILDKDKMFYYNGLDKWDKERGWLVDTCLHGQDIVKSYLDYFYIPY
ncbi:MAG TPA: Fic family protein [Erysipelotrichaceae bacterium]|nr:Fic family protein [Erysipelotrichaceae bacterium]